MATWTRRRPLSWEQSRREARKSRHSASTCLFVCLCPASEFVCVFVCNSDCLFVFSICFVFVCLFVCLFVCFFHLFCGALGLICLCVCRVRICLVVALWRDTEIKLDGDGLVCSPPLPPLPPCHGHLRCHLCLPPQYSGFSVHTGDRHQVFKPSSVQSMW